MPPHFAARRHLAPSVSDRLEQPGALQSFPEKAREEKGLWAIVTSVHALSGRRPCLDR